MDVFYFGAAVMGAFAETGSAEVEAQHGPALAMEDFHGMVDDLVVHGAAAERVGMADERHVGSVAAAFIEQSFQASCWPAEIKGAKRRRSRLQRGGCGGQRTEGCIRNDRFVDSYGHGLISFYAEGAMCVGYSGFTMSLSSTALKETMQKLDPLQFTRELVEIESTTYHEGKVGEFLAAFLSERGWAVEKTAVPQPAESGHAGARWNVYAGPADGAPELVFSTHMDTVPPYIAFREDTEFMYGRGVSDAKGIIAAQVAAAEALRAEGYAVGLLFVSGEERDSAGAKVANESPKGSRFLINGEPTDNRIALASKGALRVILTAKGKMAHSAYPELGESAIHKLAEVMSRLLALELPFVEDIGPSTLNIGQVQGGRAPNVIADHAEAQILIRLVGDSAGTRAAIEKCAAGLAEVDFTLEIPFVRLRAVEGIPTMVAKFTTDIPQLSNWGEPLLLGPGSIHVAHTPYEKLAKRELIEAVDLYIQVAKRLLGQEKPV